MSMTTTPKRPSSESREDIENDLVSSLLHSPNKYKDGHLPISQAQKRGATTPLTPMNKQQNVIRRKLEEEPERRPRMLSFDKGENKDILILNYRNWELNEKLKKHQDIIKFMEVERKFMLEEQE